MRGVLLLDPLLELELLLEAEEDDDDEEDELEPEQDCGVTGGPEIVIESILAKLSAETPVNTKRLPPAFSETSTLSSAQLDQAPVGARVKFAALPVLPLAVKIPDRAEPAPLA